MFNTSFLACVIVELQDLTVCIAVNGEKSHSDLDLDLSMPNIKLLRAIFIFKFHAHRSITY